tara:strand:+ start:1430 stop:2602 length:1173 start_codon:yes stop_codon:yes gene_type:complete
MIIKNCLVCKKKKLKKYLDLGKQPLANNLKKTIKVQKFPLELMYCSSCFHNQLSIEISKEKLFSNYLYLSSQSKTLQNHFDSAAKKYINLLNLNKYSSIIDIGSNDGIALNYYKIKNYKNFVGIEPAKNLCKIANKRGIKTINSYLNKELSKKYSCSADLVTASNVFAHNKNIKLLAKYLLSLLRKDGVLIIEVQYIIDMLKKNLFDNIYHEHIHYWSLHSLNYLFKSLGSSIYKVEKISTHGGSIRCYIKKGIFTQNKSVKNLIKNEIRMKIRTIKTFINFSKKLKEKKNNFKKFLINNSNKVIVGYGAAAKTSTLLNYLKISDNINFIIDDNILKQNRYIPGTSIKIVSKNKIKQNIDFLIVFAWNYFKEIKEKVNYAKKIISIRRFF